MDNGWSAPREPAVRCRLCFTTEPHGSTATRGSSIRTKGCPDRCLRVSAVWPQASCPTSLSSVPVCKTGVMVDWEEPHPSGLGAFPLPLHPSMPTTLASRRPSSPCSAALHNLFPSLNPFPPDTHMSLPLHCTLWVSAQIPAFQRDHYPSTARTCTVTCVLSCCFSLLPGTISSLYCHLPAQNRGCPGLRLCFVFPAEALD